MTGRSEEAGEPPVLESVTFTAACPDCGGPMKCSGVQALVDDRLRWDVESACAACGFAVTACGTEAPPAERREQLLTEHGPTLLRVSGSGAAERVTVMRVLRAELGLDLADARAAADGVLGGGWAGTRPEVERLARCLRRSGIAAEAVPGEGARKA